MKLTKQTTMGQLLDYLEKNHYYLNICDDWKDKLRGVHDTTTVYNFVRKLKEDPFFIKRYDAMVFLSRVFGKVIPNLGCCSENCIQGDKCPCPKATYTKRWREAYKILFNS